MFKTIKRKSQRVIYIFLENLIVFNKSETRGMCPEDLYNKRLCEKHFTNHDFRTEKIFKLNAAPKRYDENIDDEVTLFL